MYLCLCVKIYYLQELIQGDIVDEIVDEGFAQTGRLALHLHFTHYGNHFMDTVSEFGCCYLKDGRHRQSQT